MKSSFPISAGFFSEKQEERNDDSPVTTYIHFIRANGVACIQDDSDCSNSSSNLIMERLRAIRKPAMAWEATYYKKKGNWNNWTGI